MPRITLTQSNSFLDDVHNTIKKTVYKAKQHHAAMQEKDSPRKYWKEQQHRKLDNRFQSYDALTDYIKV